MASDQVRVTGWLGEALLHPLGRPDPAVVTETVLRAPDQAAVSGLLHRLQQDGLGIAAVRRMPARRGQLTGREPAVRRCRGIADPQPG